MIVWSQINLFRVGQISIPVPQLHNRVFLTLYHKPHSAIYIFQPLAAGTAALSATLLTALAFAVRPAVLLNSAKSVYLRLPWV